MEKEISLEQRKELNAFYARLKEKREKERRTPNEALLSEPPVDPNAPKISLGVLKQATMPEADQELLQVINEVVDIDDNQATWNFARLATIMEPLSIEERQALIRRVEEGLDKLGFLPGDIE